MRGSQARPRLHFHVANVLVRLRRFEAAANAYARVLRASPDDAAARFQHAWCLLEVPGRRAEGIAAFQRLLEVRPSASGFYLLACGLQRESRHAEAVEAFREVLRREAGTSTLFYNYALSLEAAGCYEEAANAYRDAALLEPSDRMSEICRPGQIRQLPATWISASTARAVALTLLDRHSEAIRLYEEVLAVDPSYFERWQELEPHYRRSREAAGPQSPTAA